ncbi:MAG: hypothetical protein N3D11_12805 [Candidatus Sumerlaeia bacterium]|nr:hypothetical protein [Candidatus Sumerlaeia bacterium]
MIFPLADFLNLLGGPLAQRIEKRLILGGAIAQCLAELVGYLFPDSLSDVLGQRDRRRGGRFGSLCGKRRRSQNYKPRQP